METPVDANQESSGSYVPSLCRASVSSVLYAGSSTESVIACRNSGEEYGTQTAFLVAGYLQPHHTYTSILQNFSVVRQARVIENGETVSFLYNFLPSPFLEPGDYNLVLGVYFQAGNNNKTFFSVAYNGTIMVEASNMDPRTIMTYITLVGIVCGVVYGVAAKMGMLKSSAKSSSSKSSKGSKSGSPTSPNSEGCDMDYISKEHQRYVDAILNPTSPKSSSPKASSQKASSPNRGGSKKIR